MGRIIENLKIFENSPESEEELLRRLWPQKDIKFGYLGQNENLGQIIQDDATTLVRLRLSHEQIAIAIEELFASDDHEVNGNPITRVYNIHSPECPWGDFQTTFISPDFLVTEIIIWNFRVCPTEILERHKKHLPLIIHTNDYPIILENNYGIIFSDLHPHLIREHQFFEGRETPYRVDPERITRYLGLIESI